MKRGVPFLTAAAAAFLAAAVLAGAAPTTAAAAAGYEDYRQRQQDLAALAGIFGDLHAIRRQCEPRAEADVWRERMKTLIELEAPLPDARQDMIAAFNRSYRAAQRRHPLCNRRARDAAAAQAARAETLVARLTAPLYEALEQGEAPIFAVFPETGAAQTEAAETGAAQGPRARHP